jgi:hypothetical protein
MSSSAHTNMGFTEEPLPGSHHICLIYDDDAQRERVVGQYLDAGLRRGEQVRCFVDSTAPERLRSWLAEAGTAPAEAEAKSALLFIRAEDAYCPGGSFDPRAVIAGLPPRYRAAREAGFTGSRTFGEMSWALRGLPGSERFLEYEALLNTVDSPFPHHGMCQYDARRFDGATLFKVLQLHPFMIAQGQIVRNPYFTRAEEFLGEGPPGAAR